RDQSGPATEATEDEGTFREVRSKRRRKKKASAPEDVKTDIRELLSKLPRERLNQGTEGKTFITVDGKLEDIVAKMPKKDP
ncbi:hypothetical protein, partial [Klebsiella pneumoniae]|uniref:hypothetical protein n=1 Tax=Klebsiella pneumoniae TaxID=573 RepID=UPI0040553FB1